MRLLVLVLLLFGVVPASGTSSRWAGVGFRLCEVMRSRFPASKVANLPTNAPPVSEYACTSLDGPWCPSSALFSAEEGRRRRRARAVARGGARARPQSAGPDATRPQGARLRLLRRGRARREETREDARIRRRRAVTVARRAPRPSPARIRRRPRERPEQETRSSSRRLASSAKRRSWRATRARRGVPRARRPRRLGAVKSRRRLLSPRQSRSPA